MMMAVDTSTDYIYRGKFIYSYWRQKRSPRLDLPASEILTDK